MLLSGVVVYFLWNNPMADIRIVLVRARNPLNIGACARAMANFDLEDLALVRPYAAAWEEARSAVGAIDVLARARRLSLPEAVSDRHLVLGTTSGRRRALRQPMISLPELESFVRGRCAPAACRLAVLFGSEKTGLTNSELACCHALVGIPTSPKTPSMNLSHGVAVVAYELSRAFKLVSAKKTSRTEGGRAQTRARPPTQEQMEELLLLTDGALREVRYMQHMPPATRREILLRIFQRWSLTGGDASLLQAIFKRVILTQRGRSDPLKR